MKELKTPDFTAAQAVAVVGAIIALAVAFGFDISQEKQDAIKNLVIVLAPVLLAADAVIRHGRSRALALPPKGVVADDKPVAKTRRAPVTRRTAR